MKTILITGSAGGVATRLRPYLRDWYALRLLDRVETPDLAANEAAIVGDLADPDTVRRACEGVDAVVHLACAYSYDIDFEDTLDANYRGVLYLLDACRKSGIGRFVFASSHHVVGHHRVAGFAGDAAPVAPDGFYALSKAFGEAACSMYAHRYGIRTLSIRIGSAADTVVDGRRQRLWVGNGDLAQLVRIGLEHEDVHDDIVYGVSRCPDALFENGRALELGYRPTDDAARHLDPAFVPLADMSEADGRDYVGGPYVPYPLNVRGTR
jgi:uronate dehydrogenase